MENNQKASLDIKTRKFEVDMAQNLISQVNRANLTMAEVKGCLTLPMKTKYHWKKVPPKGDFNYEIKLTGDVNDNNMLSAEHFTSNPITCKIQGSEQRACKGTFHVETCDSELDLFFDASKVKNCPLKLTEDRTFNLPFRLVISDDATSFTIDDYLEVTVKKFTPQLKFQFVSDYSYKNKLVYSESATWLQVGKLIVSHNASFSCAPAITNEQFRLTCAVTDGSTTIANGNERNDLLQMRGDNWSSTNYVVRNLEPGQCSNIPVFFNVVDAGNPASANTPNTFTPVINNRREICSGNFEMWRNQVLTKKKVFFQLPNTKLQDGNITNLNRKDMGDLFMVEQADTDYTLTLTFTNEADATDPQYPNAAVLVWNVAIDQIDYDYNRIKTRKNKDLKELFKFTSDKDHWELNPRLFKTCQLEINLKAGDIEGIMPMQNEDETYADITLHLTYHAIEDNKGDRFRQVRSGRTAELGEEGKQTCELTIRLKKQPQSEWLCVDFGTSAVVAAYARNTSNDHNSLIDLKKLKEHLLKIAYEAKDSGKIDLSDEDDMLISSTICLNNENAVEDFEYDLVDGQPESFRKYSVWFSPSASAIPSEFLLPCLKTIIGYKHLPNIFREEYIKKYKYRCGNEVIGLLDEEGLMTPLMKVSEISRIIYRQLFKYYLAHRFDRNEQLLVPRIVNKLVLTIPNTYTPLNIRSVKDLARDSMPSIYPEHLHTISESDAVACYYVSHQSEFLDSIKDDKKKEQLDKKESVLVFDMGAGTLDLTWFVKETKRNSQGRIEHVDVRIKGKLGVSKAGNYIDYELADILRELYIEKSAQNGNSRKNADNIDYFERLMLLDRTLARGKKIVDSLDRMDLKNYVKGLKKMLSDPESEVPRLVLGGRVYIEGEQTDNKKGVSLRMKDILESEHFKRIINEMTQDVLENFGHRYGDNNGTLDIDVFIFSGRSTSMKAIREGVKEHISKICLQPENLLYADLCDRELSCDIEQSNNTNNSQLKTVVTQGALAYATMFSGRNASYQLHGKKYYASFGLVKHYSDRSYEYIPLIDDRMAEKPKETDGIIESCVYTVNTQDLTQVDLIQSYSSNEENDYKIGNYDTISKLCEMPCQGLEDFDVQLIMNTQSGSSAGTTLTFKVGQGCNSLDPHDDFNNISLRKSLWPVIFDNGENPNR